MPTVFGIKHGIIHIDYLEERKTITDQYYNELFDQFDAAIIKALKTMTKLTELKYELLPHPPYSSDLAPCDYYLFPNSKGWLSGKIFY